MDILLRRIEIILPPHGTSNATPALDLNAFSNLCALFNQLREVVEELASRGVTSSNTRPSLASITNCETLLTRTSQALVSFMRTAYYPNE
jgi:hypothetical protein